MFGWLVVVGTVLVVTVVGLGFCLFWRYSESSYFFVLFLYFKKIVVFFILIL